MPVGEVVIGLVEALSAESLALHKVLAKQLPYPVRDALVTQPKQGGGTCHTTAWWAY